MSRIKIGTKFGIQETVCTLLDSIPDYTHTPLSKIGQYSRCETETESKRAYEKYQRNPVLAAAEMNPEGYAVLLVGQPEGLYHDMKEALDKRWAKDPSKIIVVEINTHAAKLLEQEKHKYPEFKDTRIINDDMLEVALDILRQPGGWINNFDYDACTNFGGDAIRVLNKLSPFRHKISALNIICGNRLAKKNTINSISYLLEDTEFLRPTDVNNLLAIKTLQDTGFCNFTIQTYEGQNPMYSVIAINRPIPDEYNFMKMVELIDTIPNNKELYRRLDAEFHPSIASRHQARRLFKPGRTAAIFDVLYKRSGNELITWLSELKIETRKKELIKYRKNK